MFTIFRYFRDDESELSLMTRHIGNVTKDTEFTFEFGVRKEAKAKRAKKKPASMILEESADYDNPPKPTPEFDNPVYHGYEKQSDEKMETDQPSGEQVYDNASSKFFVCFFLCVVTVIPLLCNPFVEQSPVVYNL